MVPHLVSLTSGYTQSSLGVLAIKRVDELYQAGRVEVYFDVLAVAVDLSRRGCSYQKAIGTHCSGFVSDGIQC